MELPYVFLNRIKMDLDEFAPSVITVQDSQDKMRYHEVTDLTGLLSIDQTFPKVKIIIQYRKDKCFENLPSVRIVDSTWLSPFFAEQDQNMDNWHRYKDGRLCWIYPQTWYEKVCVPMRDARDAERAAMQLIKNVKVLLGYHLEAYRRRYLRWRKCWEYHPHGN